MPEEMRHALGLVVKVMQIAGACALVLGFLITSAQCLRRWHREGLKPAVAGYRRALGRAVLGGLEILIAATIITTVMLSPTAKNVAFLAITVAIRTVLGWTMGLEIYGRWPWQKPEREQRANSS